MSREKVYHNETNGEEYFDLSDDRSLVLYCTIFVSPGGKKLANCTSLTNKFSLQYYPLHSLKSVELQYPHPDDQLLVTLVVQLLSS